MRRFTCRCGERIFFDNLQCLTCGSLLGFDAENLAMVALAGDSGVLTSGVEVDGYRACPNRVQHGFCNWWVRADAPAGAYCVSCDLTGVIPNLSQPRNELLWARMERAKQRLLYDLIVHGLFRPGASARLARPTFRFLEDQRRNPFVEESFVSTGHYAGTITINMAEAEDSVRHELREYMQERYRTLLGHFRHESGHFYFQALVTAVPGASERFRALFGDERADYAQAIQAHYRHITTEPVDLQHYVSGYAAAHPLEDWAETWAHFLHINAALETASSCGVRTSADRQTRKGAWLARWGEVSVTLNELNRSLGMDDPYPFALSTTIVKKLEFVREAISQAGQ